MADLVARSGARREPQPAAPCAALAMLWRHALAARVSATAHRNKVGTIVFDKFLKSIGGKRTAPPPPAQPVAAPPPIVDVTDADFAAVVEQSPLPAVVDFWADWCDPVTSCRPMSAFWPPDYAGRMLVALDVDENPGDAETFQRHGPAHAAVSARRRRSRPHRRHRPLRRAQARSNERLLVDQSTAKLPTRCIPCAYPNCSSRRCVKFPPMPTSSATSSCCAPA